MIHDTQSAQISQKQDERKIYAIMKTMCPPSYHHNDSVATQRQLTMDLCIPCLAFWALFGSLVPAMCNRPSCAQVHELTQSHCGDNWEATLFSWLHVYYAHLASVRLEHFLCLEHFVWPLILCSFLNLFSTLWFIGSFVIYIYIYIYIYILKSMLKFIKGLSIHIFS